MKKFTLLFLITISLAPLTTNAQSGRKGTKESPAKTDTKTGASDSQSSTSTDNIPDSRTPAGGETVEGDVIRVDTSLVTVPVTVADRNGRYVPSLRREDFHIFEDGAEQRIAYFAAVDQPFTVVLLIDTSGSTQFRLEDIQDAAINFVGKLKSEDSVMVMSFDDSIDVLCRPTTDRNATTRAIHRTRTGGGTRLYDAVDAVLEAEPRVLVRVDPLDDELALPESAEAIHERPIHRRIRPAPTGHRQGFGHRPWAASGATLVAGVALRQILRACAEVRFAVAARGVVDGQRNHRAPGGLHASQKLLVGFPGARRVKLVPNRTTESLVDIFDAGRRRRRQDL